MPGKGNGCAPSCCSTASSRSNLMWSTLAMSSCMVAAGGRRQREGRGGMVAVVMVAAVVAAGGRARAGPARPAPLLAGSAWGEGRRRRRQHLAAPRRPPAECREFTSDLTARRAARPRPFPGLSPPTSWAQTRLRSRPFRSAQAALVEGSGEAGRSRPRSAASSRWLRARHEVCAAPFRLAVLLGLLRSPDGAVGRPRAAREGAVPAPVPGWGAAERLEAVPLLTGVLQAAR